MEFKFVCLNLWFGGILFDDVLAFLKQQDADVVALQEVFQSDDKKLPAHYRSLESLNQQLHYPHQRFAPAVLDAYPWGNILNGNAVLSRFPIKEQNVTFFGEPLDMDDPRTPFDPKGFPTTPRNLQHVVLNTRAGELDVFNFQGVWDLDGDNASPQRQKMSETIIQQIAGKQRVIVAGDTNARYTNPVMRSIENHLVNVFGDSLTTSFNMRRKSDPGYGTSVVDMVYASKNLSVASYECPNVNVSDHLPLVVRFKVDTESERD
jgi:endonuclease/exonuclease/phosphatase family metal-dependent hydrolase